MGSEFRRNTRVPQHRPVSGHPGCPSSDQSLKTCFPQIWPSKPYRDPSQEGLGVLRIPSGFSRRLRGFEAHRMLFELRIRILWKANATNLFSGHQKIEKSKMLRIEFWTSDFDVKKCSKRPRDPHNQIRLEKLCPKVVSDRQNAGRMTSKRRFWHFRPIIENRALNVNNYD